MASRKTSNPNKPIITRIILMMFVWIAYVLFTLACVSFNSADPPSHMTATFTPTTYHNWCGAVGDHVAYLALQRLGPGVFVGIVLLGIALVLWTRGDHINQLALRIIGTALLVAAVSTLFNMTGGGGPFGEGAGGMLGIALGSFLTLEFKHGAWFLLLATFVVGGLLAADEFMLALPARLLWVGKRLPTEPVAAVATGAAGGVWGGVRGLFESFGPKSRMGKSDLKANGRKKKDAAEETKIADASTDALKNPPETTTALETRNPKLETPGTAPEKVVATPVDVVDNEHAIVEKNSPAELVVRKPAPRAAQPFPTAPRPAQDFGNYKLPGLDLLDEAEPIDTAGQEQRVREKAKVLEAALESFNIDGKVEAIDTGPVVTLYELSLAPGHQNRHRSPPSPKTSPAPSNRRPFASSTTSPANRRWALKFRTSIANASASRSSSRSATTRSPRWRCRCASAKTLRETR